MKDGRRIQKLPMMAKCESSTSSVDTPMIYLRTIDHEKVWKFMFYQCMRTQRKRGGRKNRGDTDTFIRTDYDLVMESYKDCFGYQSQPPPEPANPVGKSAMAQYKAALRLIYKNQVAVGKCGKTGIKSGSGA
jgi:hypothetical protein